MKATQECYNHELLSSTGINMMYSSENMKPMNRKQKVLFGGKELKDNT